MWRWFGGGITVLRPCSIRFSYSSLPIDGDESLISDFCDAFRSRWSWDVVSKRFGSVQLTASMVDRVLLQLKESRDAEHALGFFHWASECAHFEHTFRSYSIAVHILVNASMVRDARSLLQSVLNSTQQVSTRIPFIESFIHTYPTIAPRPLVFDLLIQSYSKLRMFDAALEVSLRLQRHGFYPSLNTYNMMLHFAEKSGNFKLVWEIYELMITNRTYPNESTTKTMVDALCMQGELQKSLDTVDKIHCKRCSPLVVVNTCLIFRVLDSGRIDRGLVLLRRLLQRNMILDTIYFSLVVYARVKEGDLNTALGVVQDMVGRGFRQNSFVYTCIISCYCENDGVEEACCMAEDMEKNGVKPYDETFNHIISGCANAGMVNQSLIFCQRMMKTGLIPSIVAANDMVVKLCELGYVEKANTMMTLLLDNGFSPNECTYSCLINGFGEIGDTREVLKIFYEMEYKSILVTTPVFMSIIDILSRCKKFEEAEKFSRIMKDREMRGTKGINKSQISLFSRTPRYLGYDI